MAFVDEVKITVYGGDGGNGCASFRRARFRPLGGPDGGNGGDGGNVILIAEDHTRSLFEISKRRDYRASKGDQGSSSTKKGSNGEDQILSVPIGTLVKNAKTGELIVDLDEDNKSFICAKGGTGGRGNKFFTTSTNQAPSEFEQGTDGEVLELHLEVKLIADIGLVGLPNAGKSTLLSSISGANPKIGAYPFTTLNPHLGILRINEEKSFIVADIPGLIKGAHKGKGMGIDFLKHVERTRFLVHLIDPTLVDYEQLEENFKTIRDELSHFSQALGDKFQIVVLTKRDAIAKEDIETYTSKLQAKIGPKTTVISISSISKEGLDNLFTQILKVDQQCQPAL